MSGINFPSSTTTITLQDLDRLQAQGKTPKFATTAEATRFEAAVDTARLEQRGGVANPTLMIPTPVNAADLGLVQDNLGKAAENVPFSLTELLTVLHQLNQELKNAARAERTAEQDMEVAKLKDAANDIRAGATFALVSGVVGGSLQIASGVMSGIGAARAGTTAVGEVQDLEGSSGMLDSLKQRLFYTKENINLGAPEELVATKPSPAVDTELASTTTRPSSTAIDKPMDGYHYDDLMSKEEMAERLPPPGSEMEMVGMGKDAAPKAAETPKPLAMNRNQSRTGKDGDSGVGGTKDSADEPQQKTWSKDQLKMMQANAERVQQTWQVAAQVMKGMGDVVSAAFDYQSKEKDAQRAEDEAIAKKIGNQAQTWDDMVKDMAGNMQTIRQTIGDINSQINQTNSRIWS